MEQVIQPQYQQKDPERMPLLNAPVSSITAPIAPIPRVQLLAGEVFSLCVPFAAQEILAQHTMKNVFYVGNQPIPVAHYQIVHCKEESCEKQ